MKIDKKKLARQKLGFKKWQQAGCRGTFEWVTGMGKTFTGILVAKWFIQNVDSDFTIAVVTPSDILRTDWHNYAVEHKIRDNFIAIDTVHNLVKKDMHVDLLILDEIHKYLGEDAEVFPTVFNCVKSDRILGLTATLGDRGIQRHLVDDFCPVVDTIELEEAIENGWIADYILYNLAVPMTNEEREEYRRLDSTFYKYFQTFDYDFDLAKECLKGEHAAEQKAMQLGWNKGAVIGHANMLMKSVRERTDFLYSNPSKIEKAKEIAEMFPDKKFISFGQTTDSADKLANAIDDAVAYHSNIQTKLLDENKNEVGRKCGKGKYMLYDVEGEYSWSEIKKLFDGKLKRFGKKRLIKYILDSFYSGKYRGLCTAKAADEGLDDKDIELGIIIANTSNIRQIVQRIGRVVRKKKGKRAIIVRLYNPDSQDEQWLENTQTGNSNVKNIVSLTQITT